MHSPKASLDVSKSLSSMEENVLSSTPKAETWEQLSFDFF
jgi:hypothetical protein